IAVGMDVVDEGKEILVVTEKGFGKRTPQEEYRIQARGGFGLKTLNVTERNGLLVAMKAVDGSEDLMLITIHGILIRMDVNDISIIGRSTQGVRLIRLGDDELVATIWPQGTGLSFPATPVPATINWDVWQGTCATDRPYNPGIHPFKWRGFWDYGCGALGDIGCHSMNSAFWVLNLKGDFVVESSKVSEFDENMAPKRSTLVYDFPAKGKRCAVKVIWQDGVNNPNTDKDFVRPPGLPADLQLNEGFGQVFVGTEGTIFVNDAYCGTAPIVYPEALREKTRAIEKVYPRVKGGPTQELCRAVRGDGPKPISNFVDHAGPLTEMVLVGNLAVRLGKKIDWDMEKMEARGLPEVKAMLKRKYRAGWEPKLT
ncbi:MAG: DNA gyrase C-terminal beta-propeller domain-containing protein, partial [Luteolibacter sp.]